MVNFFVLIYENDIFGLTFPLF